MYILVASFFGISYFSSKIFQLLNEKETYTGGVIALLPVYFSVSSSLSMIQFENCSPLLGFLIAIFTYGWMRNWQITQGSALILLLLFKGIGVTFCPIILMHRKWKLIATLGFMTVLLNAIVLYCGGINPYIEYFKEIVPKAYIPISAGIPGLLFNWFGVFPKYLYLGLNLVSLGFLYFGFWRARQNKSVDSNQLVATVTVGLMSLFCSFNVLVWSNYITNYVWLPLAGWILWEARQNVGLYRNLIWGVFLLHVFFVCDYTHAFMTLIGLERGFFQYIIPELFWVFEGVFLLGMAFRRLYRLNEGTSNLFNKPYISSVAT